MKSAEDQANEINKVLPALMEPLLCSTLIEVVSQIQLDAYKQGMTDAAEVQIYTGEGNDTIRSEFMWKGVNELRKAILTARDNKTTI